MVAESSSILFLVVLISFILFEVTEGHRYPCTANQFHCFFDKCISRELYCNGNLDCGGRDNSDERYCATTGWTECPGRENGGWTRCTSLLDLHKRRCIPNEWICDGIKDCPDYSDEMNCPTRATLLTSPKTEIKEVPSSAVQAFAGVPEAHRNLTQYFLDRRQSTRSINKWGPHLLRTAVALFLADKSFFFAGNKTGEEISYELSLQLMSKLSLKKKMSTRELSLFVNALTASCINPREFFEVDLVGELRERVSNQNITNPFTILTLCNAQDTMTADDVLKLQLQFHARLRPLWTDTQALATMALACISSRSNATVDERILREMVRELKRKQFKNGTIDNLKTTAIVVQALLATDNYQTDFDLGSAIKFILQQINSRYIPVNDLYYILPILNSKSLMNIDSNHCASPIKTDMELFQKLLEDPDERIQVQFSVHIGNDMEYVRTWRLKVPANYTFYQVLESIGSVEPSYKVHYDVSEGKPYVNGLNGFFDDVVDEMFWFLYTRTLSSSTNNKPNLIEESPVDVQVKATEEIILWYRSRA